MVDRIQKIIQLKKLTSSKFADQVGVPRSTISHILSGRNNPSLEFLQKILDTFPDINTEWLVRGEGPVQTIPNSLFSDDDFYPSNTKNEQSEPTEIVDSKIENRNRPQSTKERIEYQNTKPEETKNIPSNTDHISTRMATSPSPDIAEGDNDDDKSADRSQHSKKGSDVGSADEKDMKKRVRAGNRAEKIIIIYSDGTFSEHIPNPSL